MTTCRREGFLNVAHLWKQHLVLQGAEKLCVTRVEAQQICFFLAVSTTQSRRHHNGQKHSSGDGVKKPDVAQWISVYCLLVTETLTFVVFLFLSVGDSLGPPAGYSVSVTLQTRRLKGGSD